jgi:25S rRNA (cytosine2870-C5)-methyltransferase
VEPLNGSNKQRSSKGTHPSPSPSDSSWGGSDEDEDKDGPITMANMESRSRALDARAAHEAELDLEELQEAAVEAEDGENANIQAGMGEDGEPFRLPTAQEREEERKSGGPDVVVVQRRMAECARVLGNFKKLAASGTYVFFHGTEMSLNLFRSRSEYVEQLTSDIVSYYGYNEFLAEKLFLLFPVAEVGIFHSSSPSVLTLSISRLFHSLRRTRYHDP